MDLQCTLMNSAVLQRNSDGFSEHNFKGRAAADGKLLLTVRQNKQLLDGFDKLEIGSVCKGKLTGCIKGLPTGGPYDLELKIAGSREKLALKNILVGDLWLLAGQSNMADSGYMPSLTEESDMVHAFYMNNIWDISRDPLHDLTHAVAPVHGGNPNNPYPKEKLKRGTGPGSSFGLEMYKTTGVPQGLIACAHGGTSMDQWDPALKKDGGYSLYGALYQRLQMLGGKVAGLLWYQGCNECGSAEKANAYEQKTRRLFAAVRRDCRNPELPIVLAQLAAVIVPSDEKRDPRDCMTVRRAQYRIAHTIKNCACVPAIDLELDDTVHLSNKSVNTLGKRFAAAMNQLRGAEGIKPEIEPGSIKCVPDPVTQSAKIIIKFKNVHGKLISGGVPCGFSVLNEDNSFHSLAVNARLDGDTVTVMTRIPTVFFSRHYRIAYGAQLQPNANITDEAGRSLPCFIASAPKLNSRLTEMVQHALISEAVFTDDSYAALKLPENYEQLKYAPAPFQQFYMPAPRSAQYDRERKIYVYKMQIKLAEDMKLKMLFGADAPFALYLDGKEFSRQCTGNPVVIDEFQLPMQLTAGVHDIVCVFSSNGGCGWGICCRFKRLDGKMLPEIVNVCESGK